MDTSPGREPSRPAAERCDHWWGVIQHLESEWVRKKCFRVGGCGQERVTMRHDPPGGSAVPEPLSGDSDVLTASRIVALHRRYERGCRDCPEPGAAGDCPTLAWAVEIRRRWGGRLPPVDPRIGLGRPGT